MPVETDTGESMTAPAALALLCLLFLLVAIPVIVYQYRRDALRWRRLENAMDIEGSAMVVLEQFEQSKLDHQKWVDSFVRRGEQSVADLMRLH